MLLPNDTPDEVATLPDERTLLFLRIARRADELVQESRRGPGLNRVCWLIAEQEVTGRAPETTGS